MAAAAALGLMLTMSAPNYLNLGWSMETLPGGVLRVVLSFCIGIVICRLSRGRKRTTTWLALLPLLILPLILCIAVSERQLPALEMFDVLVIFPAALLAGIVWEPPASLVAVFAFLGDISYPLYIFHHPLVFLFVRIMNRFSLSPTSAAILFALIVAILAAFVAHFYDRPVRAWLSGRLKSRRSAPEQIL